MSDSPISRECAEGRHEECGETLENCQCTFRGSHTTQHAYATMSDKDVSIPDTGNLTLDEMVSMRRKLARWKLMENDEGTFYMERCGSGDWVSYKGHLFTLIAAEDRIRELEQALRDVDAKVNTPETEDFFKAIPLEAAHQRLRWPAEDDAGKTPADWFWLIGYLAGKCLHATIAGNTEKALHHTISTAAALANWHRAIKGVGDMRSGIDISTLFQKEKL